MITLTTSAAQDTIVTVPGNRYAIGIVGNSGGGLVLLESNLEGAPTEFSRLGDLIPGGHFTMDATGTLLRATVINPTSATNIKIHASPA